MLEPSEALSVDTGEAITYGRVQIGPDGAAELDGRRRSVFVPRAQIVRVVMRRGLAAERPAAHAFFGLLCFAMAWMSWRVAREWITWGGTIHAEAVTGLALTPLGVGIFWSLLRPRWYLRIETAKDARHLIFHGRVELADLRRFLARIESTQGLIVEREAPGLERSAPYREP
ncbi:Hypothetical protein A7982_02549 [Minicystis rosea]|nr:Hypothetical protein A7982_02549 [Minicystis rosea]